MKKDRCSATTKVGNPCNRKSVSDGRCKAHAIASDEPLEDPLEEVKRRLRKGKKEINLATGGTGWIELSPKEFTDLVTLKRLLESEPIGDLEDEQVGVLIYDPSKLCKKCPFAHRKSDITAIPTRKVKE